MKRVSLTINDKRISAREGEKLLWVAIDNDIYIPNLCAMRDRPEPLASCRLCFVEVEGKERPVTACTEAVVDGMVVNTEGEKALRLAKSGFALLMASHTVDCAHCARNGSCELQKIAHHLRVTLKPKHLRVLLRERPIDNSDWMFTYDPNKCVLCERCVWVCREHLGISVFGFAHRGFGRILTTFWDEPLGASKCDECDDCITVCPTGALVLKNRKKAEVETREESPS